MTHESIDASASADAHRNAAGAADTDAGAAHVNADAPAAAASAPFSAFTLDSVGRAADDGTAGAADAEGADGRPRRSRRRRPRLWFEGGSTVKPWDYDLLGWAMVSFAAGVLLFAGIPAVIPGAAGALLGAVSLWLGMAVPIVLAMTRSRPRGLLRFRALDVLYGVVLGGVLRTTQGWLEQAAAGGPVPFPSYITIDGALPSSWWLNDLLSPALISPVLEEFFFRGLLLVLIYTLVRRPLGRGVAGFVAIVSTTGLFVAAHTLGGALGWADVLSYCFVGITCGLLVLLTGRIWGAVLVHVVYNALWIGLAVVGTLLA